MEPIYKQVGRRIQELRKQKGLTQDELSERAGISLIFLSYLENGTRRGYLETYAKLSAALQVQMPALFESISVTPIVPKHSLSLDRLSPKERNNIRQMVKSLEGKRK